MISHLLLEHHQLHLPRHFLHRSDIAAQLSGYVLSMRATTHQPFQLLLFQFRPVFWFCGWWRLHRGAAFLLPPALELAIRQGRVRSGMADTVPQDHALQHIVADADLRSDGLGSRAWLPSSSLGRPRSLLAIGAVRCRSRIPCKIGRQSAARRLPTSGWPRGCLALPPVPLRPVRMVHGLIRRSQRLRAVSGLEGLPAGAERLLGLSERARAAERRSWNVDGHRLQADLRRLLARQPDPANRLTVLQHRIIVRVDGSKTEH